MKVVLASHNPGKLKEYEKLLANSGLQCVLAPDLSLQVPDEPFHSFIENALHKARCAAAATKLPSIADDSGLCVDALGGQPGVFSSHAAERAGAGSGDAANNAWLLAQLQSLAPSQRSAQFVCVIVALKSADDPFPLIAQGSVQGHIQSVAKGQHGFGYDPLFMPLGSKLSMAELEPAVKNQVSHRAHAAQVFKQLVKQYWGLVA